MYSSHQSHQFTVLLIASYITLLHIPKIISNKIFRSPFLYYLSLLFFTLFFFFYPRLHLNLKATYRIPQYSLLFQFKDPLPSFCKYQVQYFIFLFFIRMHFGKNIFKSCLFLGCLFRLLPRLRVYRICIFEFFD